MLALFTTNVIRHLKCNNIFTANIKTIIVSRDAKIENFLRGLWHVSIISLSLSEAEMWDESRI